MKQFFTIMGLYVGSFLLLSVIIYFITGKHPFETEKIASTQRTQITQIIQIDSSTRFGLLGLDNNGRLWSFSVTSKCWIEVTDKGTHFISEYKK